jgi:LuxR family maltose regulon positive regulatory protein
MCSYYRGDRDGADRWFREAFDAGAANEQWLIAASSLAYLSLIAGDRGQTDEQRMRAEQAATVARERGIEEMTGEVHVAMGDALAACAELEEAMPFFVRGVTVSRSLGRPLEVANGLIRQAAVLQALGRREAAAAVIGEARATVESCADPGILSEQIEALERPRRAQTPPPEPKLSEREVVILRMLRGPLSERDIGKELYLSHNTVHSHTRSIYRKLGVSSRSQALQRAIMLDLL